MRILIVDDSIEKITELTKTIYSHLPSTFIQTSENINNAILLLSEGLHFDLLIVDLFLPLRANEPPNRDGGKNLVNELYRKKDMLKLPDYIIGVTQSEETNLEFSNIWGVIRFSYTSSDWRLAFIQLLTHINSTQKHFEAKSIIKPCIFVEGLTDKYYIEKALEIYYNAAYDKINVISQKNAGANWVATQIPIWAMKLEANEEGTYIKAVGLFDSDEAGNIGKSNIIKRNLSDNEKKCCSIYQLKANHNAEILAFYQNKCKIEIEIESLFPLHIMQYADNQGWLEYRSPTFIEAPSDWKQHEETSIDYIMRKDIPRDSLIYAKKVKFDKKLAFCKYIESIENVEGTFLNFKPLVYDLLKKVDLQ